VIWTYASLQPRYIPLFYSRNPTDNTIKKRSANDYLGRLPQPAVLQACKESRAVGKKYYSMILEQGQECKSDCPRCRYESSDYASMFGYTKDSKHDRIQQEERNAHWVNFELDSFLLSYGTRDGMVDGIAPWPDSVDFVFNADDLARIQILHYMVATRACPYSSLAWCFRENTALKGLKKVSFQFLEGYKYGLVDPRGGFLNDLWRKEEAAQYCRRLRAKLEDLSSKNSLQLTILTRGADWN
jgi:hypothetical protein